MSARHRVEARHVTSRILQGGSGAVTTLLSSVDRDVIRKQAEGPMAAKLRDQVDWLSTYRPHLPLTPILTAWQSRDGFEYEMPYDRAFCDFHDFIERQPIPASLAILGDVLEQMNAFHTRFERGETSQTQIDRYLMEKAIANTQSIVAHAQTLLGDNEYILDGECFSLREWQLFVDLDWLRAQVRTRRSSVIHGDLTIENIIVNPKSASAAWYLIDPNPRNIFDTPLIDWSKISQSLNLGYEALNRSGCLTRNGTDFAISPRKSFAYGELCRYSEARLARYLGTETLREIAFHEIINYLRLIRSKMCHDPHRFLLFFVCAGLLLRRYTSATRVNEQRFQYSDAG